MERPLCPLCKTNHYAREGCVFGPSRDVDGTSESSGKGDEAGRVRAKVSVAVDTGIRQGQGKADKPPVDDVRQPFDRVRYQREYMRSYRASKRAKVLADGGRSGEVKSGSV